MLRIIISGVAEANQTKERSVHELFARAFRNKSSICDKSACLPKEKHKRIHQKKGEIHDNFSFWPFLWFAWPGRLRIINSVETFFACTAWSQRRSSDSSERCAKDQKWPIRESRFAKIWGYFSEFGGVSLDRIRKILVSVKMFARNSGAGNGCAIFLGAWKDCAFSAGKPPCP